MKIKPTESSFIANKIAIDLANSGFVSIKKDINAIAKVANDVISKDIKLEMALESKVKNMLEENIDEIYDRNADEKQLFWLIKKRVADEYGVILEIEDRFSNIAHQILDDIWNFDLMDYDVAELKVRNVIVKSIMDYTKGHNDIEKIVSERMSKYRRKVVSGSEEYEILKNKLFEDELRKRGMM
jgi:hypothetical protein